MKNETLTARNFLSVFRNVKLPWLLLLLAVAGTILNYIFTLQMASLSVDVVNTAGDVEQSLLNSYIVAGIAVVFGLTASTFFSGIAAETINLSLRTKLWSKLIRLPRSQYDKDKGEGLVSRITTDCTFASTLFTVLVSLSSAIVGICIYYGELFRSNASISMVSFCILPVSVLIAWGYGKLRYIVSNHTQERLSQTTSYLIERVYNLPLIRAANMQETERQAGVEKFNTLYEIEIKKGLLDSLNVFINSAMPLVTMAVVFVMGGKFVNEGTMTAGSVYAFYLVANQSAVLFANIVEYFGSVKGSFGAMDRVVSTLQQEGENTEEGVSASRQGQAALRDVRFSYGDKDVLKGVNLEIPENKLTVIVGSNGAGKSTVFRLLERYYGVVEGSITLNGTSADTYSLESWRRIIGYMPQDGVLMAGTIRSNLSMGAGYMLEDEEIDPVIRSLGIGDFIAGLSDGYDTVVEAGGSNFSGGQKQLLGMARVLLYDPQILLLDESTSNLDGRSARQVKAALEKLRENRTIVMIAHDLQTILEADHAIVLHDGKVESEGDPRQVLSKVQSHWKSVMNKA